MRSTISTKQRFALCSAAVALLLIALFRFLPPGHGFLRPSPRNRSATPRDPTTKPRTHLSPIARPSAAPALSPVARRQRARPALSLPPPPDALTQTSASDAYPDEAKDALALTYDPEQSFNDAQEEFRVPAVLLKAIAHAESRGEHNGGYPNERGGRGLMGLRNTTEQPMVELSAQMLGLQPRAIIVDPVHNIRAAAALLRSYRDGSSSGRPCWADAVARYSGLDPTGAAAYVTEIRKILTEGAGPASKSASHVSISPGQAGLLELDGTE